MLRRTTSVSWLPPPTTTCAWRFAVSNRREALHGVDDVELWWSQRNRVAAEVGVHPQRPPAPGGHVRLRRAAREVPRGVPVGLTTRIHLGVLEHGHELQQPAGDAEVAPTAPLVDVDGK